MRSYRVSASLSLLALLVFASCGGVTDPNAVGDGGAGSSITGASAMGAIGSPCVTEQEAKPNFLGFAEQEVSVQTHPGDPSGEPVCLVNHFRGLTACPYGQDGNGQGHDGAPSCKTSTGEPVVGDSHSPFGSTVQAQCVDRRAADTVIVSCRCANDSGKTDDGDNYCTCPSTMTCASLITSIGGPYDHLAGSYCIKAGTAFDPRSDCSATCDVLGMSCN